MRGCFFHARKEKIMGCKHEQERLIGTADGIVCLGCGRAFENFADLIADRGDTGKQEPAPVEPETAPKKRTRKKT